MWSLGVATIPFGWEKEPVLKQPLVRLWHFLWTIRIFILDLKNKGEGYKDHLDSHFQVLLKLIIKFNFVNSHCQIERLFLGFCLCWPERLQWAGRGWHRMYAPCAALVMVMTPLKVADQGSAIPHLGPWYLCKTLSFSSFFSLCPWLCMIYGTVLLRCTLLAGLGVLAEYCSQCSLQ